LPLQLGKLRNNERRFCAILATAGGRRHASLSANRLAFTHKPVCRWQMVDGDGCDLRQPTFAQ
jgi:hypothetical protein